MKIAKFLLISSLTLFSACTVGPDYQKPDVKFPPQLVSQKVMQHLSQQNNDQALPTNWWEGFKDPDLTQLVETGIINNYEIASAIARVEQAEAAIRLADSEDALSISASGGANSEFQREINGSTSTDEHTLSGSLDATLPLDIFGGNHRAVEAARANYEAVEYALRGVVLGISADIVREYITLRGNQQQLNILRESVDLQEKTLKIVQSRYKAGLSPELDYQRAIRSIEGLRSEIPPLEKSLKDSRSQLATLIGKFPGTQESDLIEQKPVPLYHGKIPDILPLDIIRSRYDVQQAEANLKAAVARIGVAESAFYPAIELNGSIALTSIVTNGLSAVQTVISTLGAMIDQYILDGGARQATLDITKSAAKEALADYESALRTAVLEVETALTAIQSSASRQQSLQKVVDASARSFSQAGILYQQGLISFLDVVDAQSTLATSRQALAREQTNYITQIANLFEVLGTQVNYRNQS